MITHRIATANDAAAVQAMYAPYVRDTAVSFEAAPPDVAEMARRIATSYPAYPWLAAFHGETLIGYGYASAHRARAAYQWSSEVSAYVAPGWQGRKIGQQLVRAVLRVMELQGYRVALAGISLPNAASQGLYESLGFVQVAHYPAIGYKHSEWRDMGWWQKQLGTGAPATVVPLDALPPDALAAAIARQ